MKLIVAALAVCFASAVNALTTVTFDHNDLGFNPATGGRIGESQGFTYDFSYAYLIGQHLSLHDDTGLTSSTISQQNGNTFTPISIDLLGFSRVYMTGSGPRPTDPYDYSWYTDGTPPPIALTFQGIRGSQVVASQSVSTSARTFSGWGTTLFGSSFSRIDKLVLTLQLPTTPFIQDGPPIYSGIGSNQVWCDEWCGEYWVDNLEVAPVPLPSSGWLLLGAILGLTLHRATYRSQRGACRLAS